MVTKKGIYTLILLLFNRYGMNSKLKSITILALLIIPGVLILVPVGSYASSPSAYVDVTLKNSQTTATPSNFSQMLNVNWSLYASDLNANVSNVRFYTSSSFTSGSELSGWIETNNTTTATSSTVWVNLSSDIISASGSITIYMAFLPTTASWSSHWGLASKLSTNYGQFDNGAKVFPFYCNFAGTSLNTSKWVDNTANAGGTLTINNGMSYTRGTTRNNYPFIYSVSTFSADVFEAYGTIPAGGVTGSYTVTSFGLTSPSNINDNAAIVGDINAVYGLDTQNSGGSQNIVSGLTGGTYVWQVLIPSSSPSVIYGSQNYGTKLSSSTDMPSLPQPLMFEDQENTGINLGPFYWVRVRAYPPDGVMPSVTFGSLTTYTPTNYHISFQQTSLPSGTKWGIRLNNTTSVIWQNSTTQYDNITGLSGNYTFQVINATGYSSNPYTGLLDVSTTNLTQSIVFTGYSIAFVESGLPSGYKWYVNLTDQSGLSESTAGQKISGTAATLYAYEPN